MFTIEEITLLHILKDEERRKTIDWIKFNYRNQKDLVIIGVLENLLFKLNNMTDEDFDNIDFSYSLIDEPDIDWF